MADVSAFWDRHAAGYAKRPVSDQAAYERKLKVTQDYLRPDMEVLELACGTGTTALIHAPFAKHVRAVDISEKMLDIARRKAADQGVENVTFERSSVEDFAGGDGAYDVVMTHSVLHLLADKEAAIAKIRRLLKPGGAFVSSTVCIGDMLPFWRLVIPIARLVGLAPMVKVFTAADLVRAIEAAGFRIDHEWRPGKRKAVFIVAVKP